MLVGSEGGLSMSEIYYPSDQEVNTYGLIKLIAEVMACIENTETKEEAQVDILSDEIMIVTIDDKRFRIMVQDTGQFS